MSFPVPNLDDRSFQDLVDSAKRLIPRYLPEWTNHNVSDPGVALIELFAWFTELQIFRLNQVPEKTLRAFLDLVGVSPFGPAAAQADVTFLLSSELDGEVTIPVGTEVSTSGDDPVTFQITTPLTIRNPRLSFVGGAEAGPDGMPNDQTLSDRTLDVQLEAEELQIFSDACTVGDALYLGFEDAVGGLVVELRLEIAQEGVGVDPRNPPIMWEVWMGEDWLPAILLLDETGGLNRSGRLRLHLPSTSTAVSIGGRRLNWLRLRLVAGTPEVGSYRTSPVAKTLEVIAVGGVVRCEHSSPNEREYLALASGDAGMRCSVSNFPCLPRKEDESIEVIGPDGAESRWTEVDNFAGSKSEDRHFTWDSGTGVIQFGPRVRYPDGTYRQHGSIPEAGSEIWATGYRTGGGSRGNVGAGSIRILRSAVPYVDSVENLNAARGGVDAEDIDEATVRGPLSLASGNRAVTAADHESLAMAASPRVARAHCIPASDGQRPTTIWLVPKVSRPGGPLNIDELAFEEQVFEEVGRFLDQHRLLGARIEIGTPRYQGVSVTALIRASPGRSPAGVRQRCLDEIYQFLCPLTGSEKRTGWPLGGNLTTGAVMNLIGQVEGVAQVLDVALFEADPRNMARIGDARDIIELEEGALFLSVLPQVVVR